MFGKKRDNDENAPGDTVSGILAQIAREGIRSYAVCAVVAAMHNTLLDTIPEYATAFDKHLEKEVGAMLEGVLGDPLAEMVREIAPEDAPEHEIQSAMKEVRRLATSAFGGAFEDFSTRMTGGKRITGPDINFHLGASAVQYKYPDREASPTLKARAEYVLPEVRYLGETCTTMSPSLFPATVTIFESVCLDDETLNGVVSRWSNEMGG